MKKYPVLFLLAFTIAISCKKELSNRNPSGIDYRKEMRSFVKRISEFSKEQKNDFVVIPQNGQELLTASGLSDGVLQTDYILAIDGVGREELFYGYDNHDDLPTPKDESDHWLELCRLAKSNGLKVLVTDYTTSPAKVVDSYRKNNVEGFISFAAPHRELDNIPSSRPYHENALDIDSLDVAQNFLYLINSAAFPSKQKMLQALTKTNYDVIIIDLFFQEGDEITSWKFEELSQMKVKRNGARRLVICYMSIGEAEDYRYYWKKEWQTHRPEWLEKLNPQWTGNYKVKYWMPTWQKYIFGDKESYTQKVLNAGFDGAYLDLIDAYEYWENQ